MTHAPHNARRIQRSSVPHARLHAPAGKDLLLGALVGGTMLIITGLYAATFRYQKAFQQPTADFPRWMALADGVVEKAKPIQTQVDLLKGAVSALVSAKKTQSQTALVLKQKIEAMRSASATTETP